MKEFLRTVALFSELKDSEIELLARTARERHFIEGSYIVREGEPGSSAYVLKEGAAETLLEKPGGPSVHLSNIGPSEIFGEIALFNGDARSASVIATRETTVIEISRDRFLEEITSHPETSLKLMAAVSRRLRHSESIVSNYADRIYGDVMPRLESAVHAQLESAETIYDETKDRVSSVVDQVENKWTILTRGATLAGVVIGLMAGLGIYNLDTTRRNIENNSNEILEESETRLMESVTEVNDLKTEVQELVNEAQSIADQLAIDQLTLQELKGEANRLWMGRLWMDKLRHDLRLDEGTGLTLSGDRDLSDVSRDFLVAQRRLRDEYFGNPQKWESEILLEALGLLMEIQDRQYLVLESSDWDKVFDGIDHILRNPPKYWRPLQRLQRLVTALHRRLINGTPGEAQKLKQRMLGLLSDPDSTSLARRQTALILARIGSDLESVKRILREALNDKDPWQRSEAAIALIALGENAGWEQLRVDLSISTPVAGNTDNYTPEGEPADKKEAALAAGVILAENMGPQRGNPSQERFFTPEALSKHLSPDNPLSLVANNIIDGLKREPNRWNVFYWRFACDLVCDLGCRPPWEKEGEQLCRQCFDTLFTTFPKMNGQLNRTAESCAVRNSG